MKDTIKRLDVPSVALNAEQLQRLARLVAQYQYFEGIVLKALSCDVPFYGMALTLMLKNFRRPVVLFCQEDQEEEAVRWAEKEVSGVFALGSDGLDLACRTTCSSQGRVFSPFFPPVGRTDGWTHEFLHHLLPPAEPDPFLLCDALNNNVAQVFPGDRMSDREDLLGRSGVLIILNRFRTDRSWLLEEQRSALTRLRRKKIPVVVVGLPAELEDPQTRRQLLMSGVIPAGDMTREAALVKLMWTLARTGSINGVRMYFSLSFGGEVTQTEPLDL